MYEDTIEIFEFIDQIKYILSREFLERWRCKYSTHFIKIFQERVYKSMADQKPLKKSSLVSTFTKKHRYNERLVEDFFNDIDLSLYYPLIYEEYTKPKSS